LTASLKPWCGKAFLAEFSNAIVHFKSALEIRERGYKTDNLDKALS